MREEEPGDISFMATQAALQPFSAFDHPWEQLVQPWDPLPFVALQWILGSVDSF